MSLPASYAPSPCPRRQLFLKGSILWRTLPPVHLASVARHLLRGIARDYPGGIACAFPG